MSKIWLRADARTHTHTHQIHYPPFRTKSNGGLEKTKQTKKKTTHFVQKSFSYHYLELWQFSYFPDDYECGASKLLCVVNRFVLANYINTIRFLQDKFKESVKILFLFRALLIPCSLTP